MICEACGSKFVPHRHPERCDACAKSIDRVEGLARTEAVRRLLQLRLAVRRFEIALAVPTRRHEIDATLRRVEGRPRCECR